MSRTQLPKAQQDFDGTPRGCAAAVSAKIMSRTGFYALLNNIRPARYDLMTKESRARTLKDDSVNYLTFNRDRFYQTVSAAFSLTDSVAPVICDMGVFPGALIHVIPHFRGYLLIAARKK